MSDIANLPRTGSALSVSSSFKGLTLLPNDPNATTINTTQQLLESCIVCRLIVDETERVDIGDGVIFHEACFVCFQCLLPFPGGLFFENEKRFYCEHDYHLLFGHRCYRCGDIIHEKIVTALDAKWHIEHFVCESCGRALVSNSHPTTSASNSGESYVRRGKKAYCSTCDKRLREAELHKDEEICQLCKKPGKVNELVTIGNKRVHPHHHLCTQCKEPLKPDFKRYDENMYCVGCYAHATAQTCAGCKRPIQGRLITAMGKAWHPEHFGCASCEKPFYDAAHYEWEGKAYCEAHYKTVRGEICLYCDQPLTGKGIFGSNRKWCDNHFVCFGCDKTLANTEFQSHDGSGKSEPQSHGSNNNVTSSSSNNNLASSGAAASSTSGTTTIVASKHFEWDGKPFCGKCFDALPLDLKLRLRKYFDLERKAMESGGVPRNRS